MKISEYIASLQAIMNEHGDLPCYTRDNQDHKWTESNGPKLVAGDDGHEDKVWYLPKRVEV